MKRVALVTNIAADNISGGFSGMNRAILDALEREFTVDYIGPINPPTCFKQRFASKVNRTLGLSGRFFFFSKRRLDSIQREVDMRLSASKAELVIFHGFTPWIHACPRIPYAAWSDCTFRDYISFYHRRKDFHDADLARIESAEALWLARAESVLFTSEWAADRTIRDYKLDRKKARVVGTFGAIPAPAKDVYVGSPEFAFVSTDFKAKGGLLVVRALQQVRIHYPAASLVIVGADPGPEIRRQEGVRYEGFLHKDVPTELERFVQILATCRCIVHPTQSDISPLILSEAAYCGCPAISSRRFAIPEIVEDRKTGILLDHPESVDEIALAMLLMLGNEADYFQMRAAAWERSRSRLSAECFSRKLLAEIRRALCGS